MLIYIRRVNFNFKNIEGKKNLKTTLNGTFSWQKKKYSEFYDIILAKT